MPYGPNFPMPTPTPSAVRSGVFRSDEPPVPWDNTLPTPEPHMARPPAEQLAIPNSGNVGDEPGLEAPLFDVSDIVSLLVPMLGLGVGMAKMGGRKALERAQGPLIKELEAMGVKIAARPSLAIGQAVRQRGKKALGYVVGHEKGTGNVWLDLGKGDATLVDPIDLVPVEAKKRLSDMETYVLKPRGKK